MGMWKMILISKNAMARSNNLVFFGILLSSSLLVCGLRLTVLHINDFHAHIEQINEGLTRCRPDESLANKCYGGISRIYSKVKEIRDKNPKNTIVLHAGDFYQGTIWYSLFKFKAMVEFANMINFTAMCLGNHEFDDGIEGLIPFLKDANFPVVTSNIESNQLSSNVKKSVVVEIDGQKVGIIGYLTPSTKNISKPGKNVTFKDEVASLTSEARRLKSEENVSILIGLGHSGYLQDIRIAQKVPDLDFVIGGHSHSFLFTGKNLPSIEKPEGPYPTFVSNNEAGKVVPVVQAYYYSKYLGYVELDFDRNGDLKVPVNGKGVLSANPILLDSTVSQSPIVLEAIERYKDGLSNFTKTLGIATTHLTKIDYFESTLGNVITDSMLMHEWKDIATIAFINNGALRSGFSAGNITGEDILNVLPFNNTIDLIVINGTGLLKILESSASKICPNFTCHPGLFLQVSGLRVNYLIVPGNENSRVVQALERNCDDDLDWCEIMPSKNYSIAIISYLAKGGGRLNKFVDYTLSRRKGTFSDYETFVNYLQLQSPLDGSIEGRIVFHNSTDDLNNSLSSSTIHWKCYLLNNLFLLAALFHIY